MKSIENLKSWIGCRLFIIFTLLIVIPLTIVGIVSYSNSIQVIEKNLQLYAEQLIGETANSINIYFKEVEKTTLKTSKQPSVTMAALKPDAVSSATPSASHADNNNQGTSSKTRWLIDDFKNLFDSHNDINRIYLATESGKLYSYPSTAFEKDFKPADAGWYNKAIDKNGIIWGSPFKDSKTGTTLVTTAIPVYPGDDSEKQPIGVLAIEISLDEISDKLNDMYVGKTNHPYLLDENGRMLVYHDRQLQGKNIPRNEVLNAINSSTSSSVNFKCVNSGILHKQFAVFKKIDSLGWTLVADIHMDELSSDTHALLFNVIIVGGITLLIAILISSLFSGTLTGNIKLLMEQLQIQAIELSRKNDELDFIANHDPLTELPNRRFLMRRLESALKTAQAQDGILALLFLDLDRFKNINDSLGHDVGDMLLVAVSKRLLENVRGTDTVCRQGGDEFIVLIENAHDKSEISHISNRILESFKQSFILKNHEINATISVGVSIFPDDGDTAEMLMKYTDIAMYNAKEKGKNNVQFFNKSMSHKVSRKSSLDSDLHKALEYGEFSLNYQPQFELNTGDITGMEALLRWSHPRLGNIPPNEFIPLAEDSGLIIPIGKWVLETACIQAKHLFDGGLEIKTAVNISPCQFVQPGFVEMVSQVLDETQLKPHLLQLEITEGIAIYNEEHTISVLEQLNAMGVTTSIDDFGTGYSSLSLLRKLPIQTLKIDRSFISGVPENLDDISIINAITAMAKNLRLDIIAEGVEEAAQMDFLRSIGCDKVQGYYTGRPVPAQEFEERFLTAGYADSNL